VAETQKGIKEGRTIGVSCAMCHPDASYTPLEASPTDQIQWQRGWALLRAFEASCLTQSASVTRHLAMALAAAFARVFRSLNGHDRPQ
jgi:hypothetical protein